MSYCDDKKFVVELTKEVRSALEADLQSGIEDMIEIPIDKSEMFIEWEGRPAVDVKKSVKKEKERYDEHTKLYNYLLETSKKHLYESNNPFIIPAEAIDLRLKWIQGVFQEAYFQSTFKDRRNVYMSGLNNHVKWDAGKIRYIRHKMQGWEKHAELEGKGLSNYENTVKKPIIVARSLDSKGYAAELVKMTEELLDSYLQRGYPWKVSIIDPITGEKNPIALDTIDRRISGISARGNVQGMTQQQSSMAAVQLSEELLHSEVRNIIPRDIPTDPKEFIKWRNSWKGKRFFEQISVGESERHEIGIDGSRYVMIPLHPDKVGKKLLRQHRKGQIKEGILSKGSDPGENENAYLVYRIPDNVGDFFDDIRKNNLITEEKLKKHLIPTELEEGLFTAQEHKVFKYEPMPNSFAPKRKYADWRRGVQFNNQTYEPPSSWMPEMWESLKMQRDWNEIIFNKLLKNDFKEALSELQYFMKTVNNQLIKAGWNVEDIENMMERINSMGGLLYNIHEDSEGNFMTSNMYARKASKWSYGHIRFEEPIYQSMLEEAYHTIQTAYLPEMEAQLAVDYNILASEEANEAEKAESLERISEIENKKNFYEEMSANMEKRLYNESDGDADTNEMVLASRILATKARTLFTDHKQRRKDRSVNPEYVDQASRTIEIMRVRTQLLKTVMALQHNPKLAEYLVDQTKAASGDADIQAGLLGLKYGDERIAKMLPDRWDIEAVRSAGLMYRGYRSGANLGMWTSATNNMQRITGVINYGAQPVFSAMKALSYGDPVGKFTVDELREQVEETGVLHPGNAFVDMLTLGLNLGEESDWKEGVLPLIDIARLFKTLTLDKWLDQSKSWDKMISKARESRGESIQEEELKRVKSELYNIVHGSFKDNKREQARLEKRLLDLKLGLTQAHINRLVRWKLEYFPLTVAEPILTMKGSEERMRSEFAYMGFVEAYKQGRVNVPITTEKWKYTDSPDAVDMARLYVYMNLFGMTKVIAPKMMRGAVGGSLFQWRQYDYNEIIVEMEILRAAALSPEYAESNAAYGWGMLPFRVGLQVAKKMIRGGTHSARLLGVPKERVLYWQKMIRMNKEHDDKNLDRATTFLLTRGLASLATKALYFKFAPYTLYRSAQVLLRTAFRDKTRVRGLMGLESPLISRALTIAIITAMAAGLMRSGEDDEIEDFIRDWLPIEILTLYLWLADFGENIYRGAKPYLPTPVRELAPGAPYMDEAYEMLDDFTSF